MSKKTEWFPPEIRPVRAGKYEVECPWCSYHYWDGGYWYPHKGDLRIISATPWRGLRRPV